MSTPGDEPARPDNRPTRRRPPQAGAVPRPARKRDRPPAPSRATGRRLARAALWFVLSSVLLLGVSASLVYLRLLSGPLSATFLAASITRSLAAELPALDVAVEDVVVRLTEAGAVDIQLLNITLAEPNGTRLAKAPSAAVALSWPALWTGRLTPAKITFLKPSIRLAYSQERGFSLSLARTAEPAGLQSPRTEPGEDGLPSVLRDMDLARMFAEANARARRGEDATAFLREIGVTDATFTFERAGRRSSWRVPEARLEFDHKKKRSLVSGAVVVASERGPWRLDFRSEDSEKTRTVAVRAVVRNLVPHALLPILPELPLLGAVDAPIAVDADMELSTAGELQSGAFRLDVGRGTIRLPWGGVPVAADAARLELRYDRSRHGLEVARSTFVWGKSRIAVAGSVVGSTDPSGREIWQFDLKTTEGVLAAEEFGVAGVVIEKGAAVGQVRPASGTIEVTDLVVRSAEADLQFSGTLMLGSGTNSFDIAGRLGSMSLAAFKAFWPRTLTPGARRWVGEHVTHGQVTGGTVRIAGGTGAAAVPADRRPSFTLEAADVRFVAVPGLPPIQAPRIVVQVVDKDLDVTIPEATAGPQDSSFVFKTGRFTAAGIGSEQPQGEVSFLASGSLAAAIEALERKPLALIQRTDLAAGGIDGKVEGQLKLNLPLRSDLALRDVKLEGQARIAEAHARQVFGSHDVHNGSIIFDFDEREVVARGQVLVGKVPVKARWQHIVGGAPDKQPPLRLAAVLDDEARTHLGLDINHLVQGEVEVEMRISGEADVHVQANLDNAELVLESLTWRKPPGRSASLQFDIVRDTKQRTDLKNFKLVGDDIIIDGWVAVDDRNRLKEFHFPSVTLNLISKLDVRAVVRPDSGWDVKVKGPFFDGRDTIRSFFAAGRAGDKSIPARKTQPDLEVHAEIDTILGFSDISLRGLRVRMTRKAGKVASLAAQATLGGGSRIDLELQEKRNEPRRLVVRAGDTGQVFKFIEFYPNLRGGEMHLTVDLDGKGAADKTGVLEVSHFQIVGDTVVDEVLRMPDEKFGSVSADKPVRRTTVRQALPFERMRLVFAIGHGQLALEEAALRGQLMGVALTGKIDLRERKLHLVGTYTPLQDLTTVPSDLPMSPLLSPRGEGMIGIKFAVYGSLDRPHVYINPLSVMMPGIFRDFFPMEPPNPRITPRDGGQTAKGVRSRRETGSGTGWGTSDR
ncbi:MAG: AsmA-like C-terminal region-containing protein [Hyphomicrobiaceae bacterium]